MRLRHLLPAVTAAALLTVTACSADTTPAPQTTATVAPRTTAATPVDMTQLVVDMSWAQQSDADKNAMCDGISLFGAKWAADQMRQGAGNESVDWDRAAQLVAAKCANR